MSYESEKNYFFPLLIIAFISGILGELSAQEHWVPLPGPTTQHLRKIYFIDHLRGWAAGDSGIIIHTSDGGLNWRIQDSKTTEDIEDIFFLNENLGWALSWDITTQFGTYIHRTADGGNNWSKEFYSEPNKFMKTIMFLDSLNGWMGGFPGEMVGTRDGGIEWMPAQIDSGAASHFPVLRFNFFNPNYGFANGGHIDLSGVIWKTINGGENWSSVAVGPEPIHAIHFFDSLNVVGVGGDFEYGTGVVRSNDGGANWIYENLQILGIAFALSFRTETEGWAPLGTSGNLLLTTDAGSTWSAIPAPGGAYIYDLTFVDSLHGYAVGDDGVILKYDPNIVGMNTKPKPKMPSRPKLYQNFPNPFNPVTSIAFDIPEASSVKLMVYDALGRKVAMLVNGKTQPGNHLTYFKAGNLPSGLYYYQLIVEPISKHQTGNILTKKMIFVR